MFVGGFCKLGIKLVDETGGWYPPLQFDGGNGPRPTMLRVDETIGNNRADMESAHTMELL